jgi:ribosome recycling factor
MPSDYLEEHKPALEGALNKLHQELGTIRTGRANPQLVENIQVEAYDMRQNLVAVASITVPDPQTIQIEPWDKSIVKDVEKAIIEADLGFNPVVAGTVIRIPMPPLTEEGRLKLVKILKEKLEEARIMIRKVRDDARTKITAAEKAGDISEDEKYQLHDELDKLAARYNDKIKALGEEKEKDVMTV